MMWIRRQAGTLENRGLPGIFAQHAFPHPYVSKVLVGLKQCHHKYRYCDNQGVEARNERRQRKQYSRSPTPRQSIVSERYQGGFRGDEIRCRMAIPDRGVVLKKR